MRLDYQSEIWPAVRRLRQVAYAWSIVFCKREELTLDYHDIKKQKPFNLDQSARAPLGELYYVKGMLNFVL